MLTSLVSQRPYTLSTYLALEYQVPSEILPSARLSDVHHVTLRDGRDRWIAWDGSFVLDEPDSLPAGGQVAHHPMAADSFEIYFLADGGKNNTRQQMVFSCLSDQIKVERNCHGDISGSTDQTNIEKKDVEPKEFLDNAMGKVAVYGGDMAYPTGPRDDSPQEIERVQLAGLKKCKAISVRLKGRFQTYTLYHHYHYKEKYHRIW